jgi:hypothetical protein
VLCQGLSLFPSDAVTTMVTQLFIRIFIKPHPAKGPPRGRLLIVCVVALQPKNVKTNKCPQRGRAKGRFVSRDKI